jgi:ribonuclease D
VIWLHPLKAVLEAEAAERDLLAFVHEEQELLSTTIYPAVTKTNFLKPSDLYHLSPREQYIANELLRYRDELARSINRPPYKVMGEELVRELAAGTRQPESILQEQEVHPRFKNSRFAAQFRKHLAQVIKAADAQNLSPEKQGPPKWTPDRQTANRKAADDREKVFAPIKQALEQRFGVHAAKVLLSNKAVTSLLNGSITLPELKPAYRQALIRDAAAAAGINLDSYNSRTTMD